MFGSICCDAQMGGVNPAAVEASLRIGAKVVWMPTQSSRLVDPGSYTIAGGETATHAHTRGEVGDVRLLDEDGELLAATRDVLDLAAEHGAIVATGHTARDEHFAVVSAYAARGIALVTHARQASCQPDLSVADCVALVEMGAYVELSAITCLGVYACRPIDDLVELARAVGVDRCVASSDFGQEKNPHPTEGMQLMADALAACGLDEREVRMMVCDTPARLLGLDGA